MTHVFIQIHVQPLAQFILKEKSQFTNFAEFNHYKKNLIYVRRNQLISKFLQCTIHNSDIQRTEFGKPYLSGYTACSFNHSHSQHHYALALCKDVVELGVDIEDLNRKVRFESLAEHAFHPNELQRWRDHNNCPEYWFRVWTTKEAVLKACGLGIRMSLKELDTQVSLSQDEGGCEHPDLGQFAYKNQKVGLTMLTVAWRIQDIHSLQSIPPKIEFIQHEKELST